MEKNRKIYEIKSNADLVINYGDDVLKYLFIDCVGMHSKLNHDFVVEFDKQKDLILKRLDYKLKSCNKIVLHNKKINTIVTIKNNIFTLWESKFRDKYKYLYSEKIDNIFDYMNTDYKIFDFSYTTNLPTYSQKMESLHKGFIQHFLIVFHYYLINPYVIIPAEPITESYNAKRINYVAPPFTIINLTSNHHKQKIRQGVNVRDKKTGIINPSIAETARILKKNYNNFYYDLLHGFEANFERIERDNSVVEDEKPDLITPVNKEPDKIPIIKRLFKRASIF